MKSFALLVGLGLLVGCGQENVKEETPEQRARKRYQDNERVRKMEEKPREQDLEEKNWKAIERINREREQRETKRKQN
jgi:hypothetical protein